MSRRRLIPLAVVIVLPGCDDGANDAGRENVSADSEAFAVAETDDGQAVGNSEGEGVATIVGDSPTILGVTPSMQAQTRALRAKAEPAADVAQLLD
ncbi:MAG: hypothetical protein KDA44_13860 [Planctomycetales bacterium]|nr:hypothetical protein [Planctomycetales bacterium]